MQGSFRLDASGSNIPEVSRIWSEPTKYVLTYI